MAIVKYKGKNNVYYAYESTAQWDPIRKQSRPVRKYLGRVDPETGNIIVTGGKRGRRSERENREGSESSTDDQIVSSPEELISLQEEVSKLKAEVADLKAELDRVNKRNQILENIVNHIEHQVSRAKDESGG